MGSDKKEVRKAFRDAVFARDKYCCRTCGEPYRDEAPLDAHHIIDRHDLPFGGYVKENGISLCAACHLEAEEWHSIGVPLAGFTPEELFALIGSSLDAAIAASEALGD